MTIRNSILQTIIFAFAISFSSCGSKPKLRHTIPGIDSTIKPIEIDIEDLVNDYKSYQGKYIETTGQFFEAFEQFSISAHKPLIGPRKSFWLDNDINLSYDQNFFKKINRKTITIKGIMDTTSKGHLSMYLATIRGIYFWEKK
jgi:hypothetical protein